MRYLYKPDRGCWRREAKSRSFTRFQYCPSKWYSGEGIRPSEWSDYAWSHESKGLLAHGFLAVTALFLRLKGYNV